MQGSGKSHTVSVLLENMFIPKLNSIGMLSKPLAGLVLHFGEGGPSSRPSEAAWVSVSSNANACIRTPLVRVYVSKSSLNTMKAVYEPLGKHVKVMPLLFNESELDAEAFLSMMAIGSSESAPLYIQTVLVGSACPHSSSIDLASMCRAFFGNWVNFSRIRGSCVSWRKRVSTRHKLLAWNNVLPY